MSAEPGEFTRELVEPGGDHERRPDHREVDRLSTGLVEGNQVTEVWETLTKVPKKCDRTVNELKSQREDWEESAEWSRVTWSSQVRECSIV